MIQYITNLSKQIINHIYFRICDNFNTILLLFAISFVEHIITGGIPPLTSIGIAVCCALLETEIVSLPFIILTRKLDKFYAGIVILLYSLNLLIALISFCFYHRIMITEIVMLVMGTNEQEAREFLTSYLAQFDISNMIITITSYIVIVVVLYLTLKKLLQRYYKQTIISFASTLVILSFFAIFRPELYNSSVPLQIKAIANCFVDLKKYQEPVELNKNTIESLPDNIIVIIGESHSKNHSSLYGYEKITNPKLQQRVDSCEIILFTDVVSSATTTIPSFKNMMSTYHNGSEIVWYKHKTLPHIAKSSGYTTYWYSNQSKLGFWNNVIAKYAELFDFQFFCQDLHNDKSTNTYDEVLLKLLDKHKIPLNKKNLIIIHLMGSHPDFISRYPDDFSKFKLSDYTNKDSDSRQLLMEYDNSLLYNDFVVDKIIELFQDSNSIAIYLSDHGLDVCETSSSYAGHAKNTLSSTKASVEIPFWVYVSPYYTINNSSFVDSLYTYSNRPFMTDNLIYSIMDLMGVNFVHDNSVQSKSIFSSDFLKCERFINGYNYDE